MPGAVSKNLGYRNLKFFMSIVVIPGKKYTVAYTRDGHVIIRGKNWKKWKNRVCNIGSYKSAKKIAIDLAKTLNE